MCFLCAYDSNAFFQIILSYCGFASPYGYCRNILVSCMIVGYVWYDVAARLAMLFLLVGCCMLRRLRDGVGSHGENPMLGMRCRMKGVRISRLRVREGGLEAIVGVACSLSS